MNENKPVKHGALWTVLFAVVSLFWIFPIVLVLINSFKQKAYISKNAFSLPAGKAFVGLENYVRGIETTQFFASFGWTLLITVGSVVLILVCTSMCAWWIVRVNCGLPCARKRFREPRTSRIWMHASCSMAVALW